MSANPDFYATGYDNSMACWATNYFLVAVIGMCIALLLKHKPDVDITRVDHTRYCLMGKYALTAVSVGMAGTVHQGLFGRAGYVSSGVNANIWLVVEATLMLSGIFTINAGFALMTNTDCSWRNAAVYMLVGFAGAVVCVLIIWKFGTDAFGAAGGIGEGIPNLILLAVLLPIAMGCCMKERGAVSGQFPQAESFRLIDGSEDLALKIGARWAIAAIFFIFGGAYVQVALGPACGTPCPADCPLPSPQFDHNALFHLAQAFGMALLAFGMDKTCRAVERATSKRGDLESPLLQTSVGVGRQQKMVPPSAPRLANREDRVKTPHFGR